MAGINLNKKLWRIPQQGMVRGVCAGIANYFDVPVKLVRILVVLSTVNWRQVKRVYARWNVMSLPTLSRCVAVSVNCEESYEYSLATGRAKGEAWVQISRQAGTSYRTALWPGGCGGLGDKISCSPTAENVAGCGAGTAVKSGCQ